MNRVLKISLLGSMWLLIVTIYNWAAVDTTLAEALQNKLDSERNRLNCIGISAAVLFPNNEIWLGKSGISNPESNEEIKSEMGFEIASISKTFTASVILQLASEGALSLEDPISKWLTGYQYIDGSITIRQLLNHTSGIYNFTDSWPFWSCMLNNRSKKFTPEEILSYISYRLFNPGAKYSYCNTNYILLGMIIKKITGNELSTEFHNRIFTPLQLYNTYLGCEDNIPIQMANGWMKNGSSFENIFLSPLTSIFSGTWAAGGIVSTAKDLVCWMKALFEYNVLNREYFDQMRNFTSESNYLYGLGLQQMTGWFGKLWGHSGGICGYSSYAGYAKQADSYVAVLINQDNCNPMPFVDALVGKVVNYKQTGCDMQRPFLSEQFELSQNHPNPFNPETIINYRIHVNCFVTLKVFDCIGREIAILVNEFQNAGEHMIKFNRESLSSQKELSSGIYFYQLRSGSYTQTKKMILLR